MHPYYIDLAVQKLFQVDFHAGTIEEIWSHVYANIHITLLGSGLSVGCHELAVDLIG